MVTTRQKEPEGTPTALPGPDEWEVVHHADGGFEVIRNGAYSYGDGNGNTAEMLKAMADIEHESPPPVMVSKAALDAAKNYADALGQKIWEVQAEIDMANAYLKNLKRVLDGLS